MIDFEIRHTTIDDSIKSLKEVFHQRKERLFELAKIAGHTPPVSNDKIQEAVLLFNRAFQSNDFNVFNERRKKYLKILSHYEALSYSNDKIISHVGKVNWLCTEWEKLNNDRLIFNLTYTILHSWSEDIESSLSKIQKTVNQLIANRDADNLKYDKFESFKNYINYKVNLNSAYDNIAVSEQLNFLINNGFEDRILQTQYFKALIIAYSSIVFDGKKETINSFINHLKRIDDRDVFRICIAKGILEIEKTKSKGYQEYYKAWAMKYIGDPLLYAKWTISKPIFQEHQPILNSARSILEKWINEVFISAFFDAMYAQQRGQFWLKYLDKIKDVKILGSRYFLQRMKQINKSASSYLEHRFKITGDNELACVVMYFNNHVITLFSNEGFAAICKLKTNPTVPEYKYYGSVRDLVDGSFPMAYRSSYGHIYEVRNEGRLRHHPEDSWHEHFSRFLNQKVL